MADEITILETDAEGNTALLFIYPIPAGIKIAGVVPTPAPRGDLGVLSSWGIHLSAQQATDLDAGDALAVLTNYRGTGLNNPQRLAAVRAIYASQKTLLAADYTARWAFYGQRFDET